MLFLNIFSPSFKQRLSLRELSILVTKTIDITKYRETFCD
nr:MAG TPA: hypothetical protein [Caudoviricetes sp.]